MPSFSKLQEPEGPGAWDVEQNQRTEPRFEPEPDVPKAVVLVDGFWKIEGIVADVSFSGIALLVKDASEVSIGQPVELVYRNDSVSATVRYIDPQENGVRVGFELDSSTPPGTTASW